MCTHLAKRGAVYYFRRKIPLDLLGLYPGKEIMRSLRTSDKREAERLARQVGVELDREFASHRARLASVSAPAAASPHPVNVDALASRVLASIRKQAAEAIAVGPEAYARLVELKKTTYLDLEMVMKGERNPHVSLLSAEAHRNALKAWLFADGSVREFDESAPLSNAPGLAKSKTNRRTSFDDLTDKWATEKQPAPKTVARTRSIAADFAKHAGLDCVEEVTRTHVLAFKDALVARGESAANINIKLPMLGVVFNYAVDNDLIETNPASKIRVTDRQRAKEKRREFDSTALDAIFSSPVFKEHLRPVAGAGEAAYWLPLLALYTGARIEEIAQLSPQDVYEEPYVDNHGAERKAWVIRITGDESLGQGIKNESSERRIPVHAELHRLGFLAVARSAEGRHRIFHKLKADSSGHESGNFSKWFGRYLRDKCGVADRRMVFHSFRHTFKHLARQANISTEVHNALTGHTSGDVADNYGGLSYPLAPLVDAIGRYRVNVTAIKQLPDHAQ